MPLCALAMVLGSLSGALLEPSQLIVIASFIFAAVLVVRAVLERKRPAATFVILLISIFTVGFALSGNAIHKAKNVPPFFDELSPPLCGGIVLEPPEPNEWGVVAPVRLDTCTHRSATKKTDAVVRLLLTSADADLMPDQRISFRGTFSLPRDNKNPGGFSWRKYLLVHGIGSQGKALGNVERISNGNFIETKIETIRREIADAVSKNIGGKEFGIVLAMAIGDQSRIDGDVRDTFANTGLAHLVAVSGLNVAYVAALVYFLSRLIFRFLPWLLRRFPIRSISAAVTLPAVVLYVLVTGSVISCVRAAIMLGVFLLAVILNRRQDLPTTLAVSVVAVLLFLPLSILDISFQLSAAAVAGLIFFTPIIMKWFRADSPTQTQKIVRWFSSLIAVSLAAGISTAPIIAYHFKFMTALSLPANIIAVPLAGAVLTPLVALASLVTFISTQIAALLWKLCLFPTEWLVDFAAFADKIGSSLVFVWAPNAFEVALAYLVIIAIFMWRKIGYKKIAAACLLLIVLCDVGYWRLGPLISKKLSVTILDVGQGDSAIVKFPGGKNMLIDGGGARKSEFDIGKKILAPALWRMGVRKIDWILLTHPHHDHYRGLSYIAQKFSPKIFWTNGLDAPDEEKAEWDAFVADVKKAGVPFVIVEEKMATMGIGGAKLRIIKLPYENGAELNDTSLVAEISFGAHGFLFTGDLPQKGEEKLLRIAPDISAAFLKVAHHGGKGSSSADFLNAVKPQIATISAGERNRYGMPNKDTLARLEKAGAEIYRTDLNGAITVTSDGKNFEVETVIEK